MAKKATKVRRRKKDEAQRPKRAAPADPMRDKLIAAVEQSPALVAVHDKDAWCSLYAVGGEINDPVGSRPHVGRAAIERFYDTFIAPNGIAFNVERDCVCGMSVMRDLTIDTTMSTGVKLRVPMHLRYDLVEEDGALKIRRLFAHWELLPMILQLLGKGPRGWWTAVKLGPQLLRNQGFGGMLGFMRGFLGVGGKGKRRAVAFLSGLRRFDTGAAAAAMASTARLEWPAGTEATMAGLVRRCTGKLSWRKVMASGYTVTASIELDGEPGVALLEFDSRRFISRARFYVS